ncbi:MAG TPA: hypothetical protein VFN35_34985 [Ktedonobacteraceae bacterium]|nr:hypothetical protein [Ktedonobacteraceae bacterium]
MSPNSFPNNYTFGVHHYRHLLDIFYKHFCYDGRFVLIGDITRSPFSDIVQRQLKTDTIIQRNAFLSYGVEEKVVAWPASDQPHEAFFLETRSCTNAGRESDGWMKTCQADVLLYAFEIKDVGLLLFLFPFPRLKQWFWNSYLPHLPRPDTGRSVMCDENRTEGYVVARMLLIKAVPTRCFLITFDGEYHEVKPDLDIRLLRERFLDRKPRSDEGI